MSTDGLTGQTPDAAASAPPAQGGSEGSDGADPDVGTSREPRPGEASASSSGGSSSSGGGSSSGTSGSSDGGSPVPTDAAAGTDPPPDAANDAGSGIDCGEGGILCGGSCVDPTRDPLNCNGCGNVCHDGRCGSSIAADMQAPPGNWVFNGTAFYNPAGPSAAMTVADVLYQAGSVIYRNPIAADQFTARFAIRMGEGGGTRNDGMAFTMQTDGPTALSGPGAGLAIDGLHGYGVELDIVDNGSCGDISDDHVGIDWLRNCPEGSALPTSLFSTDLTGLVDLADATWHQVVVDLREGTLSVDVDDRPFVDAVPLPGFVPGTPYYFGFAGATGGVSSGPDAGGGYQTEVKDVSLTFPTPRCL